MADQNGQDSHLEFQHCAQPKPSLRTWRRAAGGDAHAQPGSGCRRSCCPWGEARRGPVHQQGSSVTHQQHPACQGGHPEPARSRRDGCSWIFLVLGNPEGLRCPTRPLPVGCRGFSQHPAGSWICLGGWGQCKQARTSGEESGSRCWPPSSCMHQLVPSREEGFEKEIRAVFLPAVSCTV